ncbi:RHS repeat-associated core domain-containing protein [Leclercia sp. LTM14]|nr:RHS repeat-associated core domain-containing protein [Leclercia sp. LTM14]
MSHTGASTYTHSMAISATSNRSVLNSNNDITPAQVDSYFDARGNMQQMQAGTPLCWNTFNQLQSVIIIDRGEEATGNDREVYQYCQGQRLRKQAWSLTNSDGNLWQVNDVIYLPGLEIRRSYVDSNGSPQPASEVLHSLNINSGNRAQIRMLHWEVGQPTDIEADQIRYSLDNLIGSVNIELDASGNILSREEYYPFGGSAVLVGNSSEVKYKYVRFSGKERDSAGLYAFGHRYYAPWLFRWISHDPAGTSDMVNAYCYVGNNPITDRDISGGVDSADLSQGLRTLLFENTHPVYRNMLNTRGGGGSLALQTRTVNTFANAISQVAAPTHRRLLSESRTEGSVARLSDSEQRIIRSYSEESVPFHNMLLPHGLTKQDVEKGYRPEMAAELHAAMDVLPAYPGHSYRGALLANNVRYIPSRLDHAEGIQMIAGPQREADAQRGGNITIAAGDYVTTQTFFSTSASRGVASEFVMRQRFGRQFEPDTVLFDIDAQSGRNITELTELRQAEVLLQPGAIFQITHVEEGDLGLRVGLHEVPDEFWDSEEVISGRTVVRDYRFGSRVHQRPQYPAARTAPRMTLRTSWR